MARERILYAALARFAASGYAATSLRDIAGDVGIKAPSIYAHFPNKRALYEAVYTYTIRQHQDFFTDLVDTAQTLTPPERLRVLLFGVPDFYRAHPDLANFHLRAAAELADSATGNQAFLADEQALSRLVTDAVEEGTVQGYFRPQDQAAFTTMFLTLADGLFLQLAYYDETQYQQHQRQTWLALETLLSQPTESTSATQNLPSTPNRNNAQ